MRFFAFWRCAHARTTFPQSPVDGHARGQAHITCLECGREFGYDWANMRIVEKRKKAAPRGALRTADFTGGQE